MLREVRGLVRDAGTRTILAGPVAMADIEDEQPRRAA